MNSTIRIRISLVRTALNEWIGTFVLGAGLVVGILAERSIFGQNEFAGGIILFGAALALCLWVWSTHARDTTIPTPRILVSSRIAPGVRARPGLAGLCAILSLVAYLFSAHNQFTTIGVAAWVFSVLLFLAAFWQGDLISIQRSLSAKLMPLRQINFLELRIAWTWIFLAALIMLGAFFYFYRLSEIPAEPTSDHAEKILDVYDVLQGNRPIFFERNAGREPLQFYMIAALITLLHVPLEPIALKIVTAGVGLLAVPLVFFMAREMFDETVAFIAAFLVAVSIWPVAIARVGLRFPFTPLFVAALVFFLVRGLKNSSRNDFLLAGVTLGLGLMGYNAFRAAPLLVLAFLLLWPVVSQYAVKTNWRAYVFDGMLLFVAALLTFLPLLHYSLEQPDNFWMRSVSRLGGEGAQPAAQTFLVLLENTWHALLMFNFRGDNTWVNAITNDPVVDYYTGALVLIGAAYAAFRLIRYRERRYLFVFAGIVVMLLPSIFSIAFPGENPSVVRAGGAIPLVMTLAALPLGAWIRQYRATGVSRVGAWLPVLLLFSLIARENFARYYDTYDAQYRLSAWNSDEVAAVLKSFAAAVGDEKHAYLVSFPFWVDHRNVGIFMGEPLWDNRIERKEQFMQQAKDPAPKIYILNKDDKDNLTLLQQLFPGGLARVYHSRTPTREFEIFTVLSTQ